MEEKYGGVSLKGQHLHNQDSYCCLKLENLTFLVLADGLGSKKLSNLGSKAICSIISSLIMDNQTITQNIENLIEIAHQKWVEKLSDFDLEECSSTCLVSIIKEKEIVTAHLGDGFICVFDKVNDFISVGEELDFVNETHSLSYKLNKDKWVFNTFELDSSNPKGTVIMCSDGISINDDNLEDILKFCQELSNEYEDLLSYDIEKNIKEWLKDWQGSDDKTITFFIRK